MLRKTPGHWQGKRGSAHDRGYGAAWVRLRKRIMQRDCWLCQVCKRDGRLTPATECDHVVPKAEGGTDDAGNLQAICASCHQAKTKREAAVGRGDKPKRQIGADGWPLE